MIIPHKYRSRAVLYYTLYGILLDINNTFLGVRGVLSTGHPFSLLGPAVNLSLLQKNKNKNLSA